MTVLAAEPPVIPQRMSGVLAPITALPNRWGMGDLGPSARAFVDLLHDAGQAVWQILPLTQPGNASNSPYDNHSPHAINRWLISLDDLVEDGLLEESELASDVPVEFGGPIVDYGCVYRWKERLLDLASERLLERLERDVELRAEFDRYERDNADWLDDFLAFRDLKERHKRDTPPRWSRRDWPIADRSAATAPAPTERTHAMWQVVAKQFLGERQWARLRDHARERGVAFVTDMPFYEGDDSVTVWKLPELFDLDDEFRARCVGGAPPKPTAPEQAWGTPAYRTDQRAAILEHFAHRIAHEARRLGPGGFLRLDHVLGAVEPWVVPVDPSGAQTRPGGFEPLIDPADWNAMLRRFPDVHFIGEDRGQLTPRREELVETLHGARIRLAVKALTDPAPLVVNEHFADNVTRRDVLYAGSTHDDPFLRTYLTRNADKDTVHELGDVLVQRGYATARHDVDQLADGYVQLGLDSDAGLVVTHVFDVLRFGGGDELPGHLRAFNVPGTVSMDNWATRIPASVFAEDRDAVVARLRAASDRAGRLHVR